MLAWVMVVLVCCGLAHSAHAHERRTVAGQYELIVGFLQEPAFAGQMNGLDLQVTVQGRKPKPVEGLERTLQASVLFGDDQQAMPLALRRRYGKAGAYAGHFLPTRPGTYAFRLQGAINGVAIDEIFRSGPGTFHDVEDATALRFPDLLQQ